MHLQSGCFASAEHVHVHLTFKMDSNSKKQLFSYASICKMVCKLERNAYNTAAQTLSVTRKYGEVLQSKYKMDPHATASILLPSKFKTPTYR